MIKHDLETLPRTKAEARSAGSKYYFTGEPCKNGHLQPRNLRGVCVECHRNRVRLDYQKNPEPQKKRSMDRYNRRMEEEPEKVREEGRIRQANWKAENYDHYTKKAREYKELMRDYFNALARDRYAEDPERFREKRRRNRLNDYERKLLRAAELLREWRKNNPEKSRAIDQRKRAKRKLAEGTFSCEDIDRIRSDQKDKCAYCRKPLKGKGQVDHIVALARGGTNWPNNLQLACGPCNNKKRAKDPLEFAREMGWLL